MPANRPALFLDRDGIVNVDRGYVGAIADFVFMDGIFELGRAAAEAGWPVVIVTNQSGIGRGLYSEDDFHALTRWMTERLAEEGAPVARVQYCPYHPTAGIGRYRRASEDRKPAPGMILKAAAALDLDLGRSILVGDQPGDIAAAKAAGIGTKVLVGEDHDAEAARDADIRVRSVREAAERVAPLLEAPIAEAD